MPSNINIGISAQATGRMFYLKTPPLTVSWRAILVDIAFTPLQDKVFKKPMPQKRYNSRVKLRGLAFKNYLERHPNYSCVKVNVAKETTVVEEIDTGYVVDSGLPNTLYYFGDAEQNAWLVLKYDFLTPVDPTKLDYFKGRHMVTIESGQAVDGRFVD